MRARDHLMQVARAVRADPKRGLKDALGRAAFGSGLHRSLLRGRALVLCFHSINDTHKSPIASTSEEFARWVDFLAAHFEVIALDELLDRLRTGRSIDCVASVTFDDGYLDNYLAAAPILEARGMTATFFVATEFIGSRHQAWWDSDCDIESRWMGWEHLRDLQRRGFSVGAHTRTHADLGAIDFAAAIAEIDGAVEHIARETGTRPTLFAYPFGGKDNMSDAVREYVRSSGLRCCPSAFGGLVTPTTDPFDLPRVPVSPWYVSPYQMGLEMIRLRNGGFTPHQARSRPD